MGACSRFGPGFYVCLGGGNMVRDGAFGHGGADGSVGFAYVINKMQMVGDDDPRTVSLAQAVHASLKG